MPEQIEEEVTEPLSKKAFEKKYIPSIKGLSSPALRGKKKRRGHKISSGKPRLAPLFK